METMHDRLLHAGRARLPTPESTWTTSCELSPRAGARAAPAEGQVVLATDAPRERKEPLCSQD
jgi:hypothetical protein